MGKLPDIKFSEELGEKIELLSLKKAGEYDAKTGLYGWHFPYGSTGLFSCGDGSWLISHNRSTPEGQCSYIHLYRWNGEDPFERLTEE